MDVVKSSKKSGSGLSQLLAMRPKPTTLAVVGLVAVWGIFQWRDPTPPAVLDQLLVLVFSVWFTNEAVEKRVEGQRKKKKKAASAEDEEEDLVDEESGD